MLLVEQQHVEIRRQIGYERANTLIIQHGHIWRAVRRKVSHHALKLVHEELRKAQDQEDVPMPCIGVFTATMGLPFSHRIWDTLSTRGHFELTDFFAHWWLDPPQQPVAHQHSENEPPASHMDMALQQLQELHENLAPHQQRILQEQVLPLSQYQPLSTVQERAAVRRGRDRPRGSRRLDSSTQRDSSAFEHTESAMAEVAGNLVVRRVEEVAAGVGMAAGADACAGKAL
ncbi:hypothetical protein PsorP6_010216 [Peronosclerospora sorghi]|uniref:Uncharacterized protein n=1 Tax=Peronosclerospora sorghi TaxID=230839 RepID=A0ACC0VUV6_9STRA|nr:hypothetical protein PsorP6_010216 [Peronosclerospora sorghi]